MEINWSFFFGGAKATIRPFATGNPTSNEVQCWLLGEMATTPEKMRAKQSRRFPFYIAHENERKNG